MSVTAKLKSLREKARLSQQKMADLLGMHVNTYTHYERSFKKSALPNELIESLLAVREELGATEDEIAELAGTLARPGNPTAPSAQKLPEAPVRNRTLPILGGAKGGNSEYGTLTENGSFFGLASRPGSLEGVVGAYAVYVVNDSMEPRYFAGEILHIDPFKPVRQGDFVCVQLQDERGEREYLVKRFVRRSSETLTLEQYNPARPVEIDAKLVVAVHKIVGSES